MDISNQVRDAIRNQDYDRAQDLIAAHPFNTEELGNFVLSAAGKNALGLLKFLLQHGAPVETGTAFSSPKDGLTPLLLATWEGHLEAVEILLQNGATVDASQDHQTSLNWAAQRNHLEIAKLLLRHGADVNAQDKPERNSASILHTAVFQGHEDFVQLLVEEGADLSLKNALGMTPLEQVIAQKKDRIRTILESVQGKEA